MMSFSCKSLECLFLNSLLVTAMLVFFTQHVFSGLGTSDLHYDLHTLASNQVPSENL